MPELSFQLFSARNTPLADALTIIANAGYSSVEAYGENFKDQNGFKQALDASGLHIASVHIGLEQLLNNIDEELKLTDSFGINHIVCPYLLPDARPTDEAGWVKLAEQLSGINDTVESAGKTFAWHNHDFEFEKLAEGSVPMQILLDHAPGMHWELDVGWIQRAGDSPASWLQKHASRISALHIKDLAATGECVDEDGWADLGHGVIDWQPLLPLIKNTQATVLAVEHDNPSDLHRFASNSFDTFKNWNLT